MALSNVAVVIGVFFGTPIGTPLRWVLREKISKQLQVWTSDIKAVVLKVSHRNTSKITVVLCSKNIASYCTIEIKLAEIGISY